MSEQRRDRRMVQVKAAPETHTDFLAAEARWLTVDFARRSVIYAPELPPNELFVIVSGRVSVARTTQDGKRLVTEVLREGDIFGDLAFTGGGETEDTAEALSDCRVLALDARAALRLVQSDAQWAFRLLQAAQRRLASAGSRVEEFAYSRVEARIAAAILNYATDGEDSVEASHQEIADAAGTYRETATRILNDLKARQLIRLSRCSIDIDDELALAAVARGATALATAS